MKQHSYDDSLTASQGMGCKQGGKITQRKQPGCRKCFEAQPAVDVVRQHHNDWQKGLRCAAFSELAISFAKDCSCLFVALTFRIPSMYCVSADASR